MLNLRMLGNLLLIGSSLYGLWILWNWLELRSYVGTTDVEVSDDNLIPPHLLVCVRNEEQRLDPLLQSINSSLSKGYLEHVVFVNDHSTDNTLAVIKKHLQRDSFTILHVPAGLKGKKAALMEGFRFLSGKMVLMTDADCRFEPDWPLRMLLNACSGMPAIQAGSVRMEGGTGFLDLLQRVDWYAQQFIWASQMLQGAPFLMSSANVLVNLQELPPDRIDLKQTVPSGDDIQLLRSARVCGLEVQHAPNVPTSTKTEPDWRSFWRQRLRWAGKLGIYRDGQTFRIFLFVAAGQLMMLTSILAFLFGSIDLFSFLSILLVRLIPDLLAVDAISKNVGDRISWAGIVLVWLIYPFYLLALQLAALDRRMEWKDRSYSRM